MIVFLGLAQGVAAQSTATAPHHPAAPAGRDGQTMCLTCPVGREGTGSSWQPDSSHAHRHEFSVGGWRASAHAQVSLFRIAERGPRGDAGLFSSSHVAFSGRKAAGSGVLGFRTMWSLEPYMGREGYPLLLQTGETADGVNPLVDRQHPHDFPMELAVTYSRTLADDRGLYLYLAAVGAPALGPPPFMHRASAGGLPIAPITHHWFDSTHITFGVVTVGFVSSPGVKFEASVFRGREPDERRWNVETPGLDSFSARLSVNPTAHLALQVSGGVLTDAEQLHPSADIGRVTVSAMYTRQWNAWSLAATGAWGRNSRSVSTVEVPGGFLVFPGSIARAALGEATLRWKRLGVVVRAERAGKDELFGLSDPRHGFVYQTARATTGTVFDLISGQRAVVTVGGALSWQRMDAALDTEYGRPAASRLAFVSLTLR